MTEKKRHNENGSAKTGQNGENSNEEAVNEEINQDGEKVETAGVSSEYETKLKELAEKLEKAEAELAETKDARLRLAAEYDNYRRRSQRERELIFADACCTSTAAFLPIIDNLERAAEAVCEDGGQSLRQGVLLTLRQVTDACGKLGIQEIVTNPGDPFDPALHNAVMHIEDEALPENSVAEILQKGYRIGERIIRTVTVKQAN